MILNMNLVLQLEEKNYKLGKIVQNDDGSIYLFLPTNSGIGKLKKTSIHSSGRINYKLKEGKNVFIEPLSNITMRHYICSVYVPSLECLEEIKEFDGRSTCIFMISANSYYTVDFFIMPDDSIINEVANTVAIKFLERLFLIISINNRKMDSRSEELIVFYSPRRGIYERQIVERFEAEKDYRNILFENEQGVVLAPDNEGRVFVHFGNVMRITPFLKIEFENSDLWVDKLEGNCTKMKFVVKNKRRGNQVVKDAEKIRIKSLSLDAEIYDEGFIPEGFLKARELI